MDREPLKIPVMAHPHKIYDGDRELVWNVEPYIKELHVDQEATKVEVMEAMTRPAPLVFVDHSLPFGWGIRKLDAYRWPDQINGRLYFHMDPETWAQIEDEIALKTGKDLSSVTFVDTEVYHINADSDGTHS